MLKTFKQFKIFNYSKFFFNYRDSNIYNDDIKRKIREKWENRDGNKSKSMFRQSDSSDFGKNWEEEKLNDLMGKYKEHVKEREKKRMNFNRKDLWKQRELDDVYKNFDVKTSKFRDFNRLSQELGIFSKKSFSSINELFFFIENLFSEGMLEDHVSKALDVFIRDINIFTAEDAKNKVFIFFIRQLSTNILTFTKEINFYKAAKFLDWYNIEDKHSWFNLERMITRKKDTISPENIIKIMDHFSNQNEGSQEFYDMYQYLFWSNRFDKISNNLLISLGYNLYLVKEGYEIFYFDYYKKILPLISNKESTLDLLRIMQTFSDNGENYPDLFTKLEELILSRYEQLSLEEATCIGCGFSIAGQGSKDLFLLLEKIITNQFNYLSKDEIREIVRGFIVPLSASKEFFQMMKFKLTDNLDLFNITELMLLLKSYSLSKQGDANFYELIEKKTANLIKKPEEVLLEEICVIVDGVTTTRECSRDFQKLLEFVISQRAKDILAKPKINRYLYDAFHTSGMCSVGLMNLLFKNYI